MNIGIHPMLLHEAPEDIGIGGGYLAAFKPLQPFIFHGLGDGQAEPAFAEAQGSHHTGILGPLLKFVLSHYTKVSHTAGHTLRDVIIAQVKDFHWKITALHQKGTLAATHLDVCFFKQRHGVFKQSSLALYGNT